jgi:hypothetical protein
MASITIENLSYDVNMDREAMAAITGGQGLLSPDRWWLRKPASSRLAEIKHPAKRLRRS